MEYMAAGKPVVSTRVGGLPELIEEGRQGLLVEPRSPEALAEAVGRLLRDPEEARRMGVAGRERQQREFSLDAMVRRVEQLYEELWLASPRRAT
jgi:glycosyltransferase involved in cell wall biosynthesis